MDKNLNINFNYHDFSGTPFPNNGSFDYTLNYADFKDQLDAIEHIKNVPLLSFNTDPGELCYSLTFDDGRKSNLFIAEKLAERNITGTFFIITNFCKQGGQFLNEREIKEISDLGMEIGSHSCTHRHLNRLSKEEMIKEIRESKLFLEDIISKPVHSIAYPGGQCGFREFNEAFKQGYNLNRTCITGVNELPFNKKYIKSLNIKSSIDFKTFLKILNLDSLCFLKMKAHEKIMALPKYIFSIMMSKNS